MPRVRLVRSRRDERGAFAVMYALMTVTLLSVAALGMDLGNAVARKTDTQNQADFAAYDVGQKYALNVAAGIVGTHPSDEILGFIMDSLNANQPQDDSGNCDWRAQNVACVTVDELKDADLANGDASYVTGGLRVLAPRTRVDFGFANVFGTSGTSVQSAATVNVFSAGPRVFPVFAIDAACATGKHNEGFQTVKETTNGQTNPPPVRPTLLNDTDSNATVLSAVKMFDVGGQQVEAFAVGSTNNAIELTGTNWGPTERIAFFNSPTGFEEPILAVPTPIPTSSPSPMTVSVQVPANVTAAAGIWYVRVYNNGNGQNIGWSAKAEAPVVIVDPASIVPGCPPTGSDQGNFGVVDYPRFGNLNDGDEVALNLVKGMEKPLGVQVHAQAVSDWKCEEPDNGANESDPDPEPRTNCLTTVTGLTLDPFQQGLVDGFGSDPGLLDTENSAVCGGSREPVTTQSDTYNLNNEPLSCYLQLPAGTTLNDIAKQTYAGSPAFKPEIFDSPRFGYVPIFRGDPSSLTGLEKRSIVGFQAAFITDSPTDGPGADGVHGLVFEPYGNGSKKKLEGVNMFLFSVNALPDPPEGVELIDYLGVGDPVVHLID